MKRILIATPTIDGKVYVDFVNSILGFIAKTPDAQITFMSLAGNSLIQQARNYLFTYFINKKELDYMLFFDSDIGVPEHALFQLLCRNKDIIGLPVPLKIPMIDKFPMSMGKVLNREGELLEVTGIPTAFMLISRKVADKVEEAFRDRIYRNPVEDDPIKEVYEVFKVGMIDGEFHGEDYYFCYEMRQLGFKVYADPTILVKHWGSFPYIGDFKFLLKQDEEANDKND